MPPDLVPTPRWRNLVGPGAWTDLAVNLLAGAEITDHGNHLEIHTPANPTFQWGNCIQVLDAEAADDAERWVARHRELLPDAAHLAIGLPREPTPGVWEAQGLEVSREQALGARHVATRAAASGYTIRPMTSDADWLGYEALFCAEHERERRHPGPAEYAEFTHRRAVARRALAEAGQGRFFGAFAGDRVVGHCGLVLCGDVGRFQSVLVDADHRRRGLASALVGVAAGWGLAAGAVQLVILAEAGSVAEALYRGLGFTDLQVLVGVEREPG